MLVSAPYFLDDQEKLNYSRVANRVMGRAVSTSVGKRVQSRLYYDHVLTALYSKSTDFGLFLVYEPVIPRLASLKLLHPLQDNMPYLEDQFLTAGLRKGRWGKGLYSIPKHVSMRLLYYRKDLLEKYGLKPPRTWRELEAQATHILSKEKKPRLAGLIFEARPLQYFGHLLEQLWSMDQELFENVEGVWIYNRGAVRKAVQRLIRYLSPGGVTPPRAQEMGFMRCVHDFLDGHSVFLYHWSDTLRLIHALGPDQAARFGWTLLPTDNATIPSQALLGGSSWVVPRNTRFAQNAFDVLEKMHELSVQRQFENKGGWPFPGLVELLHDPATLRAHPYYAEADYMLSHGRLMEELPWMEGDHQAWIHAAAQELAPIFQTLAGEADLDRGLDRLERRFAELVPRATYTPLVARAVDCMRRSVDRPHNVQQVAHELGVTRTHLIRCFKQDAGLTPLKFLTEQRIQQAKELFAQTHLNVGEVGQQLGFKNIHHFSRVFKRATQRSPGQYRNAVKRPGAQTEGPLE